MAAGDIRAGGAVVEITSDEKGLRAGLARAAGRLEGFEKKLKDMFGPRSLLKDAAEIALGGGAVAGVTFAAQAIGNAADKVAQLNAEFDSGQLSASEYAGEIARSVPVLGQMVTMFDKIGAAITGSGAELAALTAENEKAAKAWKLYDDAVAGANKRLGEFNRDQAPASVAALDEAIKRLSGTAGDNGGVGANMVKDLRRRRNRLAILEGQALTNDMTLANDAANSKRAAEVAAGRLNRNAINAGLNEENRIRARNIQEQADAFSAAITDALAKAAPEAAAELRRRSLQAELAGIQGMIRNQASSSFQLGSQLINPQSYGESPEVRQLRATEAKIIAAIQDLVAR